MAERDVLRRHNAVRGDGDRGQEVERVLQSRIQVDRCVELEELELRCGGVPELGESQVEREAEAVD